MSSSQYAWKTLAYITIGLFTLFTIAPLLWLMMSSFKPHQAILRNVFSLPTELYLENYSRAWRNGNLGIFFMNSIIYTGLATPLTTLLALASAYGFAKFGYPISRVFLFMISLGLLITIHSVLVPLYLLESWLDIDDTRLGVIIPYIAFGLPFQTFLATSYMLDLPDSLEEAALIDGAGYLSIFIRVILPQCIPVIGTMTIFSFLSNWNEFALVFTLTSDIAIRSLPVGINGFAAGRARDYGLQFAALMIGTAPMIIMYIFGRRQLSMGFSQGAVKE